LGRILDDFGVTDAERITAALDRARAAAERCDDWRTWSFLTLQIQLAAERMQVYKPTPNLSFTEIWAEMPEDPNSEWAQAKTSIRNLIGDIPFANWFERSRQTERNGTALTIAVPDEAIREVLEIEYGELISKVMSEIGFDTVRFKVDDRR
jgi:hypothetical protein